MRMFFLISNTGNNRTVKFYLRFLFLLTALLFVSEVSKAQWSYDINGTVLKGGKRLEGAVITLFKGSAQVQQVNSGGNGKFELKLEQGFDYTVTITKAGHITKKFFFTTKGVPDEVAKGFDGGCKPEVSLFEMPKDPNVVAQINQILSQPMAKFQYDDRQKDIVFDKAYSQSMLDALDKLGKIEKEAIAKADEEAKQKQNLESAAASKYEAAIMKGDAAMGKPDYNMARLAYTDALSIKPGEIYPKNKIIEIEKLMADAAKNAALEADYKAAIAKADAAFTAKNYDAAKTSYTDALKLKSAEVYPKTKLDEIAKLLADAAGKAELETKYKGLIAKADAAFSGKTYEGAKTSYNEALALKPAEKYPKDKIAEIDKILADILAKEKSDKELNDKYKTAISNGDQSFNQKLYSFAKPSYEEALKLKPAEQYPKTKLAEIEKFLADADAKNKAEADLKAKYEAAIAKADKAMTAKDYTNAKAGYTEASGIKTAEQYPKDKIAEINKILAELASKEQAEKDRLAKEKELNDKYTAAIGKGDAALGKKDYTSAKNSYTEALGFKPAEQYPKDKLAEIEKALAENSKAAELDAKYKAAITKADAALKAKTYEAAKAGYNEALAIKSSEQYPKDKLSEIDALLAKDASAKELNDKYNAAIAKADAAFKSKSYDDAKSGYNEALGFKAAETYPKTKLAEIDKLLADLAAKDKAEQDKLAKAKELEEKYKAAIAKADAAFGTKDYAGSKSAYNEALVLKSAEKYPKDKIAEIDAILAKEMGNKLLEEKYKAAIAKGDAALGKKDYTIAKAGYTDALGLKPAEQYPKDKMAEVEKALAALGLEKDRLAKEKELNDKYNAALAKGDAALKLKTYAAAKSSYTDALGLKPTEQYPKDKIAEVDALIAKDMGAKELDEKYKAAITKADASLKAKTYEDAKGAYNEALGFKPAEAYPKTKLAEIDKILADLANKDKAEQDRLAKEKELNEKYLSAIAKADGALGTKDYANAKTAYTEALGFKPAEKYPKDKLAEINAILAKEMGAKELEKRYSDAIAKGDASLGSKDYTSAKTNYTAALALKPAEQYPKDKLAEVDKALADLNAAKDKEAQAKALEAKYQAAIAKADKALLAKTYAAAKTSYTEASGIKPSEQYPKDKLAEIEKLIAESASEKDRLALEAKYKAAIAIADAALKAKTYDAAKAGYTEAIGIKSEQYPKDKIAEIEKILADIANKNASAKELDEKYKAAITKGDGALASKDYEAAKAGYNEAIGVKPNEKYPKDKLAAIDALIAKDANAKETEEKYKAAIAKADEAYSAKDYSAAKTGYTEASGIKSSEQYPKDQLMKVNAVLADLAKGAAAQAKYDAAISKADGALSSKDYSGAIAAYKEAQSLKANEPYPANKIAEINKILDGMARAKEKEKQYNEIIIKADKLFAAKDYKAAKSNYLDASLVKSSEKYPKEKIAECDTFLKKKNNNTAVVTTTANDDFKSDLAKKYPEGITEESTIENNAKVIIRIVVKGNEGHLYKMKTTSFGPIYYFKDDIAITENEFLRDTETQQQ